MAGIVGYHSCCDGEHWCILETHIQRVRGSHPPCLDSECAAHQECAGSQDGQERQRVDMPVTDGRIAEAQFHSSPRAARAT